MFPPLHSFQDDRLILAVGELASPGFTACASKTGRLRSQTRQVAQEGFDSPIERLRLVAADAVARTRDRRRPEKGIADGQNRGDFLFGEKRARLIPSHQ